MGHEKRIGVIWAFSYTIWWLRGDYTFSLTTTPHHDTSTIATLSLQFQLPIYMYGKCKLIMITITMWVLQYGFYTRYEVESWPLYLDFYYNQTLSGHFYLLWPHSNAVMTINYSRALKSLSNKVTKRKRKWANRKSRSGACFECDIWFLLHLERLSRQECSFCMCQFVLLFELDTRLDKEIHSIFATTIRYRSYKVFFLNHNKVTGAGNFVNIRYESCRVLSW